MRAMSAQKKDLARRLKAVESSNRQLRGQLQHFRAGLRCLPPSPATLHPQIGGMRGEHKCCVINGTRVAAIWLGLSSDALSDSSMCAKELSPVVNANQRQCRWTSVYMSVFHSM